MYVCSPLGGEPKIEVSHDTAWMTVGRLHGISSSLSCLKQTQTFHRGQREDRLPTTVWDDCSVHIVWESSSHAQAKARMMTPCNDAEHGGNLPVLGVGWRRRSSVDAAVSWGKIERDWKCSSRACSSLFSSSIALLSSPNESSQQRGYDAQKEKLVTHNLCWADIRCYAVVLQAVIALFH